MFRELALHRGPDRLPPFESARAESLLAYLLLHRDAPQTRQRLAFTFWPDSSEPRARTNLRHVLHILRSALPNAECFLEITPRTLRWRPDPPFRLDVATFEAPFARAVEHEEAALREAADAYTGDLLEGLYDERIVDARERLRGRHLDALGRLASLLADRGSGDEAIAYAERLVAADPLREDAHRLLMRLLDARGERPRALRAYHACCEALERELGTAPSEETRGVYEGLIRPGVSQPSPGPAARLRSSAGSGSGRGWPTCAKRGSGAMRSCSWSMGRQGSARRGWSSSCASGASGAAG